MGLDWNEISKMLDDVKFEEPDKRVITLRRVEEVYETRLCDYAYADLLDWKSSIEGWFNRRALDDGFDVTELVKKIYEVTFDDVVKFLQNKIDDDRYSYFDYTTPWAPDFPHNFLDDVQDDIRQKNYDAPVADTWCGDYYDEEWSVDEEQNL